MAENHKERSYVAFISYRHIQPDRDAAIAIQKLIEHFKVPKEYRSAIGSDKLGNVFRDEDELPASSSLTDSIRYALDHSRFLIVICSPDLPKSKWCEEEIRYFLSTHDRDHVLAVLVRGEPQESFSPLLLHVYDDDGAVLRDVEPIAANITGTSRHFSHRKIKKEGTRILAAMIGCPFDELWQRERRYQTRRRVIFGAIAFSALSAFSIVVGIKNLQIRAQNEEITAKNEEISKKNEEISFQNTELLIREGKLLVESGRLMLDENNRTGAAEKAVQALQLEGTHTDGAELLLNEALNRCCVEDLRLDLAADQDSRIDFCLQTGDGALTFTADQYGCIRAYRNRELRWSFFPVPSEYRTEYIEKKHKTRLFLSEDEEILLAGNPYGTVGLSLADGKLLWENRNQEAVDFLAVSDDGSLFAVFNDCARDYISVCSSKDGSRLLGFYLPDMGEAYYRHYDFDSYSLGRNFGGSFSADGRYFMFGACARAFSEPFQTDKKQENEDLLVYCVIDIEEKAAWIAGKEPVQFGLNPIFGLSYLPESDSLFFARHDESARATYVGIFNSEGELTYLLQTPDIKMNSTSVPWSYSDGQTAIAVSSADNLYLFRKETQEFTGRYELGRNIIHASWTDREHDVLFVLQDSGTYHIYPLCSENSGTVYRINGELGLNNLVSASASGGGLFAWDPEAAKTSANNGRLLLLSEDTPGKGIGAEVFTDPDAEEILPAIRMNYLSRLVFSADNSKLFLIQPESSGTLTLSQLDPQTLEIIKGYVYNSLPYFLGNPILILSNGESILYNGKLYSPGANPEAFENTDSLSIALSKNYADTAQLQDGTVLTACICKTSDDRDSLYAWKNQSIFRTFSMEEGTFLSIGDIYGSAAKLGENALLKSGKNGIIVSGKRTGGDSCFSGYFVMDASGESHTFPSLGGAMPWSLLCLAEQRPLFAAIEEDRVLRVYDAQRGEPVLSIRDADSFSGVVDIAFSSDDKVFGLLYYDGTLRIYDSLSGELLIQDTNERLSTAYGTTSLEILASSDQSRLIVRALETTQMADSHAAVYSLETGERCADIADFAGYIKDTNTVLLYEDAFAVRRCFQCPLP